MQMSSTTTTSCDSRGLWYQRIRFYHWKIAMFVLVNDVPKPDTSPARMVQRLDEEIGFTIQKENLSDLEICLESETNPHRFLLSLQPEWFHLDESKRQKFLSKWIAPDNHRCCHEICAACGSADAYTAMCPNCDQCYCDEKCQKEDWISHRHKCASQMAALPNLRAIQHSNQMISALLPLETEFFASLDRDFAMRLVFCCFDNLRSEGLNWCDIIRPDDLQHPSSVERFARDDSQILLAFLEVIQSAPGDPVMAKETYELRDCVWIALLVVIFATRRNKQEMLGERSITTLLEEYICSTANYSPSWQPAREHIPQSFNTVLGLLLWLCRAEHLKALRSFIKITPHIGMNRFSIAYSLRMLATCPGFFEPEDAYNTAISFLQVAGSNIWDIELILWLTRSAAKQDHVGAIVLLAALNCLSQRVAPLFGCDLKEAEKLLRKALKLDEASDEAQWVTTVLSLAFYRGERFEKALDVLKGYASRGCALAVQLLAATYAFPETHASSDQNATSSWN